VGVKVTFANGYQLDEYAYPDGDAWAEDKDTGALAIYSKNEILRLATFARGSWVKVERIST
jgi:hypothetical protein